MTETFPFISTKIIERLENGSFVAVRTENGPTAHPGQRRRLSPLAIIKRCIRYEPYVFQHRKPLILQLAHGLNHPSKKIALVSGPQGIGKTSLARGLIELMGSRNEQVLWFDANRYTDFEEIIHFLIRTIRDVFSQSEPASPEESEKEPKGLNRPSRTGTGIAEERRPFANAAFSEPAFVDRRTDPERISRPPGGAAGTGNADTPILEQLATLLRRVADMPLLLVLDNVEYLVDPSLRFNSAPFKETLNFLLGFPNVKMMLLGERLPYGDIPSDPERVEDIRLAGLSEADALIFLHTRQKKQLTPSPTDPALLEQAIRADFSDTDASHSVLLDTETEAIRHIYRKTQGAPWLLKILLHLNHQAGLDFTMLNRLLDDRGDNLLIGLLRLIDERLPDQHRAIFHLLGFLRHPVNLSALRAMAGVCHPATLSPERLSPEALEDLLEHSLLRSLVKISYPPQEVLAYVRAVRERHQESWSQTRANAFRTNGERSPEQRFKPGYELHQALKPLAHYHLPIEERNRIHALLQDLYLRERSREADSRILRIKNRALLNEARFHGSLLRERPAGVFSSGDRPATISLSSRIATREDGLFRTLPYPYSGTSPLLRNQTPDQTSGRMFGAQGAKASFQERLTVPLPTARTPHLLPSSDRTEEVRFPEEYSHTDVPPTEKFECSHRENPDLDMKHTEGREAEPSNPAPSASHAEAERTLRQKLDDALARQDRTAIALALLELARYRSGHGQQEDALQCLQQALNLKDDISTETRAELHRLSGGIHKVTYRHNAALADLTKAAGLIQTLMYQDDTVSPVWFSRLGKVYQDLGDIYAYRHQNPEAIEAFRQALRWYRSANEHGVESEIYFQMAALYEDLGRTEEAVTHYEKAAARDQAQGNPLSAAAALSNLGNLHMAGGFWKEAEMAFRQALEQDQAARNTDGQLNTLACLISLHRQREEWEKAEQVARQGLALALAEGKNFWQASFYLKLGELYETLEQPGQALRHYQLARSSGETELSGESLEWLDERIRAVETSI